MCLDVPSDACDAMFAQVATSPDHFHLKWTKRRPKFFESFSSRWYFAFMSFVKEPQHVLLQLPGTLARDDLHDGGLLGDPRLIDDVPQCPVDVGTPVVDVVQVQRQFHAGMSNLAQGSAGPLRRVRG